MLVQLAAVLNEHRFESIQKAIVGLETAVAEGFFTSWSICCPAESLSDQKIGNRSSSILRISGGPADEFRSGPSRHLRFDLGSLSKPLMSCGILAHQLKDNFESVLTEPGIPGKCLASLVEGGPSFLENLTLLDLLTHQSGLPAWCWFGRGLYHAGQKTLGSLAQADDPEFLSLNLSADRIQSFERTLVQSIVQRLNKDQTGQTRYSDCGYYLLAKILESSKFPHSTPWRGWAQALTELNLNAGAQFTHASLDPQSVKKAVPFFPYAVIDAGLELETNIGPSFGSCFDTNANILASLSRSHPEVSLHAGLFGTAHDVLEGMSFGLSSLTNNEPNLWRRDRFYLCFDTPSSSDTLSAAPQKRWSSTFGHLSYSGGSAWLYLDPETRRLQDYWVLLTNRTAYRRERRLQTTDRLFHFDINDRSGFAFSTKPALNPADFQPCPMDDWQEIQERALEGTKIIWDTSNCRPFPDIRAIRQATGTLLWNS